MNEILEQSEHLSRLVYFTPEKSSPDKNVNFKMTDVLASNSEEGLGYDLS